MSDQSASIWSYGFIMHEVPFSQRELLLGCIPDIAIISPEEQIRNSRNQELVEIRKKRWAGYNGLQCSCDIKCDSDSDNLVEVLTSHKIQYTQSELVIELFAQTHSEFFLIPDFAARLVRRLACGIRVNYTLSL